MFKLEVEEGLSLALVQTSFAKEYFELVSKDCEYLSQWLVWPPHAKSEEFFLTFIQKSLHDYADGKSLTCGILFNGELVGNVSFNSINHNLKKVEIGYWLSSKYQGKGIVTKSVSKLIDIAFEELGMEKVQISAAVGNTPSRRVCERLGFTLEGVLTRSENLNGRIIDHAIYGITPNQWNN